MKKIILILIAVIVSGALFIIFKKHSIAGCNISMFDTWIHRNENTVCI